jgi:hypothetical protein
MFSPSNAIRTGTGIAGGIAGATAIRGRSALAASEFVGSTRSRSK